MLKYSYSNTNYKRQHVRLISYVVPLFLHKKEQLIRGDKLLFIKYFIIWGKMKKYYL